MNKINKETMEDMKIAQIHYENWGEENDLKSDWNIIQELACFSHKDSCDFILYIGMDNGEDLERFSTAGLSGEAWEYCRKAKQEGYKYICFYA